MTEDELIQNMVNKFGLWKAQVFRLVRQSANLVTHAKNTLHINGYSLNDLILIIRGEVNAHENDHNNPHGNTLAQLSGMDRGTFDSKIVNYFPKDAVPISKVPQLVSSGADGQGRITIQPQVIIWQGRKVTVPQTVLQLTGTAKLYIRITVSGKAPNLVAALSVSTNQVEDLRNIICGTATLSGVWTISMFQIVRIGNAAISTTVRGQGIPTSVGTQAAPASIQPTWFQ